MKHYLLNVIQPEGDPPPGLLEVVVPRVEALHAEMKAAGVWVFSGGLHPPTTSTVVRVRNDEVLITDGPFAEGKEFIGGFTVVRADDLDAALEWARKAAAATGLPIEVRPFRWEA